MRIHAILLAGGSGDRFGAEMPKQFVRLAGRADPAAQPARGRRGGRRPRRRRRRIPTGWPRPSALVAGGDPAVPTSVVAGGATRNESTRNGLDSLAAADDDVVVVHDAVRPLVPVEVILRAIEPVAAGLADSTDTVIPSADTLVIVEGDEVVEIPDAVRYRRGQTPQVFRAGGPRAGLRRRRGRRRPVRDR